MKLWGLYRRDKGFVGDRRHHVYGNTFVLGPSSRAIATPLHVGNAFQKSFVIFYFILNKIFLIFLNYSYMLISEINFKNNFNHMNNYVFVHLFFV